MIVAVYFGHFKTNQRRIEDYNRLQAQLHASKAAAIAATPAASCPVPAAPGTATNTITGPGNPIKDPMNELAALGNATELMLQQMGQTIANLPPGSEMSFFSVKTSK